MSDHEQRFFRELKQELDERLTKIDRVLAILLERTKPNLDTYS